jgi:uncharacterized membrane protein
MTTSSFLRSAFLLALIVLSAQGIFHILANGEALRTVSLQTFAEQRNALDVIIGPRLMGLYVLALIFGIGSLIVRRKEVNSLAFLSIAVAVIAILLDMGLAIKFNIPINDAFKQFPTGGEAWRDLQETWVKFILIRGYCLLSGLGMMLISMFNDQKDRRA